MTKLLIRAEQVMRLRGDRRGCNEGNQRGREGLGAALVEAKHPFVRIVSTLLLAIPPPPPPRLSANLLS